jgi:hypothetical protein
VTREWDRYPHLTMRDRAQELVGWFRSHRLAGLAMLLAVGWILVQLIAPPRSGRPEDLRVGDCLFVRTSSVDAFGPGARPIGDLQSVRASLLAGTAEQASCSGSHGHEVSAIIDTSELNSGPAATNYDAACAGVFGSYVGRTTGSIYETFAVVPTEQQATAGTQRVICLIARADGQWMTHPARGSGE